MTVADLIGILKTYDPGAVVVLYDPDSSSALELQQRDVSTVTLYCTHPDRALQFDIAAESHGRPVPAIVFGSR